MIQCLFIRSHKNAPDPFLFCYDFDELLSSTDKSYMSTTVSLFFLTKRVRIEINCA